MSGVTPRDVVRQLVQSGGISILIKVANGFLAYVMLLTIARVTTTEQYGIFAVAFSVAMSSSAIAALGQPWAVTRFWPQWMGQNEPLRARAGLKFSLILSAVGLGGAATIMIFGGALDLIAEMPWSFNVAAATALFMLAQGWAEFSSAGLRAQGFIVIALAPRDVAWRVVVCAIFGGAALAGKSFQAETVVLTIGGLLMAIVFPQMVKLFRSSRGATIKLLPSADRKVFSRYSATMWAITTVQWVRDHAGVVIVSAFMGAGPAGAYFAADRTANLLAFLLLAVNLVSAPPISRYFHSNRMELVRVIVGASGLFSGFAALAGLIFFFVFGGKILALFNPVYETFLPVLLILCCGQFFIAATGPVGILLNLSGHQRISLILGISVGSVSVTLQALGAFYYGPIGVASAAAAGTVFSNLASAIYAWRVLGIDSSGLSLAFQTLRKHGRTPIRNLWPPR